MMITGKEKTLAFRKLTLLNALEIPTFSDERK